jgi:hypothetical protein
MAIQLNKDTTTDARTENAYIFSESWSVNCYSTMRAKSSHSHERWVLCNLAFLMQVFFESQQNCI